MSGYKLASLIGNFFNTGFAVYETAKTVQTFSDHPSFMAVNIAILVALYAFMAVNWYGFTRLERLGEEKWRKYFLIIGILQILVLNVVSGVAFILTYTLKGQARRKMTSSDGKFFDE